MAERKRRTKRSGKGNGHVYSIAVKPVEEDGNASTPKVTVNFPFNQSQEAYALTEPWIPGPILQPSGIVRSESPNLETV